MGIYDMANPARSKARPVTGMLHGQGDCGKGWLALRIRSMSVGMSFTTGNGAYDEKWLRTGDHLIGQRGIRWLVRRSSEHAKNLM